MLTSRVWIIVLLGWFMDRICGSRAALPAWTSIDCGTPKQINLASIEEYIGIVEIVNIPQRAEIFLESPSCPDCVSFLELNYTVGDKEAFVVTKKPLDAEALKKSNESLSFLSYSITCNKTRVRSNRTLELNDINDNAPVFEKDQYIVHVSEAMAVNTFVTQVKAFDADVSSHCSTITYNFEPPTTTFNIHLDGSIFLKKQLNYTEAKMFHLTVKAMDNLGKSGETAVLVHVWRIPGPHFEHDLYKAMIPENRVVVSVEDVNKPPVFGSKVYRAEILNEVADGYPVLQVKASDPDVGDTLQYSLEKLSSMFAVKPSSGQVYVVSVAGRSGKVTLQVKAEDQRGLYDTATVDVIITDSSSNSVTISLNQAFDSVIYLIQPMERALQKALGLDVNVMNVTGSNADVLIRLIAKETSGNIVPAKDLKNELMNKRELVQSKLAAVFESDVDFDIIASYSNTNMYIIPGIVIPVVLLGIAAILAGFWKKRRHEEQQGESDFSLSDRAHLMD